jgi:hypothetical protein
MNAPALILGLTSLLTAAMGPQTQQTPSSKGAQPVIEPTTAGWANCGSPREIIAP